MGNFWNIIIMNTRSPIITIIAMLLLILAIFFGDLSLKDGAVAGFYICVILMAHAVKDDWLILGITVLSMTLTFLTYFINYDSIHLSALISRVLSTIMIGIVSYLIIKRRDVETKLKRTNETLELRVLARIASSESKSKRLEQQVKILQEIRQVNTDTSFQGLDDVISTLRDLATDDKDANVR